MQTLWRISENKQKNRDKKNFNFVEAISYIDRVSRFSTIDTASEREIYFPPRTKLNWTKSRPAQLRNEISNLYA